MHLFISSKPYILVKTVVDLEPIQGTLNVSQKYTQEGVHTMHTHIQT